jgi:hypothetical protein
MVAFRTFQSYDGVKSEGSGLRSIFLRPKTFSGLESIKKNV